MAYFRQFPKVDYDVRGNNTTVVLTNLTRRVRFQRFCKRNNVSYDFYDVKDWGNPRIYCKRILW